MDLSLHLENLQSDPKRYVLIDPVINQSIDLGDWMQFARALSYHATVVEYVRAGGQPKVIRSDFHPVDCAPKGYGPDGFIALNFPYSVFGQDSPLRGYYENPLTHGAREGTHFMPLRIEVPKSRSFKVQRGFTSAKNLEEAAELLFTDREFRRPFVFDPIYRGEFNREVDRCVSDDELSAILSHEENRSMSGLIPASWGTIKFATEMEKELARSLAKHYLNRPDYLKSAV